MKSFLSSILFTVILAGSSFANWDEGVLGQVKKVGEIDSTKKPLDYGYPAFATWSLTEANDNHWLIEGKVVSTNSAMIWQGAKIYVQYGKQKPFLLAISDVDGKIKMKIDQAREVEGVNHKLSNIYIGLAHDNGPLSAWAFMRMYKAKSKLKTIQAERDCRKRPNE